MTTNRHSLAVGLAVLLLSSTGCISVEMGRLGREVAADVERQPDVEVERGFSMAFGRGWIGTSRFLGRLVAPQSTEIARRLGRHVRQVKVARYPVTGPIDGTAISRPASLDRYVADGWQPLVTVRDSTSRSWVLYRDDDDEIRDLLAVVVAPEDIVVTRISGNLTGLVLDAVEIGQSDWSIDDLLESTRLPETPADTEPPKPDA